MFSLLEGSIHISAYSYILSRLSRIRPEVILFFKLLRSPLLLFRSNSKNRNLLDRKKCYIMRTRKKKK